MPTIRISAQGVEITERFFKVLGILVETKNLRGIQTFTNRYGLNRRNLLNVRNNPSATVLKPEILALLVRDFDVSAEWLLTGYGAIFKDGTDIPQQGVLRNRKRTQQVEVG